MSKYNNTPIYYDVNGDEIDINGNIIEIDFNELSIDLDISKNNNRLDNSNINDGCSECWSKIDYNGNIYVYMYIVIINIK